jgi:hypothetical protein
LHGERFADDALTISYGLANLSLEFDESLLGSCSGGESFASNLALTPWCLGVGDPDDELPGLTLGVLVDAAL